MEKGKKRKVKRKKGQKNKVLRSYCCDWLVIAHEPPTSSMDLEKPGSLNNAPKMLDVPAIAHSPESRRGQYRVTDVTGSSRQAQNNHDPCGGKHKNRGVPPSVLKRVKVS